MRISVPVSVATQRDFRPSTHKSILVGQFRIWRAMMAAASDQKRWSGAIPHSEMGGSRPLTPKQSELWHQNLRGLSFWPAPALPCPLKNQPKRTWRLQCNPLG